MRDANDNNFDCLLVEDATAASELDLHKSAIEMVKTEGGIFGAVSSTHKILRALGNTQQPALNLNVPEVLEHSHSGKAIQSNGPAEMKV
jgi:hypothetical protein